MDEQSNEIKNEDTVLNADEAVAEETVADDNSSLSESGETKMQEGEYHYAKPESRLYEDAGFVPQNETTEMPRYYVPAEKKPREKKERTKRIDAKLLKVACLCLACALLGGLLGGVIASNMKSDGSTGTDGGKPISSSSDTKTVSNTKGSVNDIYERGCEQTVGITTEVTYTNFFGMTTSTAVSGTGFVVTDDGYIMTNYHVIENAYKSNLAVKVMFKDGTSYDATIVGTEEENDIAVLKIDATGLTPVNVGNSDNILVGDEVYAIGNPLGELDFTMTSGRISALDRSISTSANVPAINMFQFDAAVNSGNSGGPVFNTDGEVIGVVTAKAGESGVEGISFAIPINDAVDIANDLITKGYVSGKAYMGVNIDTRYNSTYAEYYNTPEGAYVYNVESGSCAEKCGISAGDIITKVGDDDIAGYDDLYSAIRQYKAGDTVTVVVFRANETLKLSMTFDEASPNSNSNGVNESGFGGIPKLGG